MSVYQKKNGKWYCRGRINGERYHCLCNGAKSEKDAIALEDGIRFQFRQEQLGLAKREEKIPIYTVKFMLKKYLEYSKANKSTYQKDIAHTNFFLEFFGANTDILLIKPIDIENMKVELKSHAGRYKKPLSNATINRYLSSIKKAYNVMIENGYINYNPAKNVKKLVEDNERNIILPKEKQEEFLNNLPSDLHRVIVLIALHTGLRKNNILLLNKNQVNIQKKCIEIGKNQTKGKKDIIMPLNSFIFNLVKEYYDKADFYLFINPITNKPFTTLRKSIRHAGEKVGIEDLHFHDLRRTFGTRLCQNNMSLRIIQDLLGHSNISTTQRYLSVVASEKESALESLVI